MTLSLAALAALSMALVPGGVAGQGVDEAGETVATSERPITVEVRNNGWLDMRVYAVVGGIRWRLGTASTGRLLTTEIPRHLKADIAPLQLVAYPIGGSVPATTEELLVSPGDKVDWVLENNPSFSTVFIR